MYRESPPRTIAEMAKTAQAAEVFGSGNFILANFVNVERQRFIHEGGFAHGEYALLPDKAQYDRIKISFGPVTLNDSATTVTAQVWGVGSEGVPYLLGQSELGADGALPPIVFNNHQARYYVAVVPDDDTVTIPSVFIQGVYSAFTDEARG